MTLPEAAKRVLEAWDKGPVSNISQTADAIRGLREAIERQVTNHCPVCEARWISVEDRLPDQPGEYITAHEQKDGMPLGRSISYFEEVWKDAPGSGRQHIGVNYWMPLPPLPPLPEVTR